jgi:hypothetical protein
MTPAERNAPCVKVYLGNHRTVILTNWTVAQDGKGRTMVSGTSVSSGQKEFFRVAGMRLVPLASDCDGELVPLKVACHCNPGMAAAVEHGFDWQPKSKAVYITNPKVAVSQPVKSFADLRLALRQVGGAL